MKKDTLLIFDFGGQYCHLIARRVRDNSVYSEIVPCDTPAGKIREMQDEFNIKGIILSGGPSSIYEKDSPKMDKEILKLRIPILGICYGHQLLAYYIGGDVKQAKKKEFGSSVANVDNSRDLFKGLSKKEDIWMSHGDTVLSVPKGFSIIGTTENCPVAAFASDSGSIYGIQWHPEVVHTKNGDLLLRNFIFDICGASPNWKVSGLKEQYISEIKKTVGKGKAIVALSGGVDSSTAAAIASKAIGKNLTAIFVDHGFMRKNETEQIKEMAKKLGITFVYVDAKKRFLERITGVAEPEEKRKIIGREFIAVFEEEAKKVDADYLLQGTIYPDRIESGSSKGSKTIKTHHNVGGLPERMKFKGLIEPLRELYKDEVRKLAAELGLPDSMVHRQPFPGPGLAVRIIGEVDEKKLDILRDADYILLDEMSKSGLKSLPWQYFAVLTDTKSTGVKGDSRSYGYVIALRMIESRDAMTATFSKIPYEILERISTRITNEVGDVVRVVYDITNKPPSTIEWE